MDLDSFRPFEMSWGTLGTLRPFSNFHPERDALDLKAALEKKDAVTVVRILTNRISAQRQAIAKSYQSIVGKDLVSAVKKAVSGDLESLLVALLMDPLQHEAHRLQQAMAGLGTDEDTLLEILCTRSGTRLAEISAAFKDIYRKDLEKEAKGETSGDFSKLLLALLNKEDVPGVVQRDIEALAASLTAKKADPAPWINILTSRDTDHLRKVLMGLELLSRQPVLKMLEKRFSGDMQLGLKVAVQCVEDEHLYLAQRLANAKTPLLHGILVSHCEEDLLCIRAAYLRHTGTSLYTALQKQYKGEHLLALLALCRSED